MRSGMPYIEPTDNGARCDDHAGEVFPPRCAACAAAATEWESLRPKVCPIHPMHFVPCEKCDALSAQFAEAARA